MHLTKCRTCGRIIKELNDMNDKTILAFIAECESCIEFKNRNILEGR